MPILGCFAGFFSTHQGSTLQYSLNFGPFISMYCRLLMKFIHKFTSIDNHVVAPSCAHMCIDCLILTTLFLLFCLFWFPINLNTFYYPPHKLFYYIWNLRSSGMLIDNNSIMGIIAYLMVWSHINHICYCQKEHFLTFLPLWLATNHILLRYHHTFMMSIMKWQNITKF